MECIELSDLEEGEILENENDSLSNLSESWSEEFGGSAKNHNDLVEECKGKTFGNKENKGNGLVSSESNGYKNLTRKCNLSDSTVSKSNTAVVDLGLEEVSSDGDCLSDDDWKHSCDTFDYEVPKKKRTHYGTAEDIMSEIGETISRKKSHCHKKRKSKYSFDRYKDNYYSWHHKSSHVKSKKFRKRVDSDDSNLDEVFTKRRKRKKQASYINEQNIKKPKIRDFDEMRQTLLEKIKKQKAERAKQTTENLVFAEEEVENSEIQEIEMGIDNTNYVDSLDAGNQNQNNIINETEKNKEESNDDLDLIELRLAALESNSKQRAASSSQKTAKIREKTDGDNEKKEDMNLDRYELLLRAEALKTALLKKHQKRLNKAKQISSGVNNSNDNNFLNTFLPHRGENSSDEKPSTSSISNSDVTEGNTQEEVKRQVDDNAEKNSLNEVRITTAPLITGTNLKKSKSKRKKRKSESLQNNAKENTENTEVLEEDDRTLRSQLIRDLLRKKSLKETDKKTILTDSIQTSANQLPVLSSKQPEEKEKPSTNVPKMNSLEKINVINMTKPAVIRIPKPEINRIIVHLGSEDSSDENDAEENLSLKSREYKGDDISTKESNESIRANYEKSVDLLLSQTWKKIEGELAAGKSAHNTPEAVYKHLPLSQRLEYIRLKQKIAERERLKKLKENSEKPFPGSINQVLAPRKDTFLSDSAPLNETAAAAAAATTTTTTTLLKSKNCKPDINLQKTDVVSKNVPLNSKNFGNLNQVNVKRKTVVNSNFNVVKNGRKYVAPPNGLNAAQTNQRRSLLQSSQILISKLKILLKKIKIDKTIEENYEKEISKLKNQINLFEKKKVEQKMKIKKLAEESLKTYKLIQQITNLAKKPKEESVKKKNCGEGVPKCKEAVKVSEESKTSEIVNVPEAQSLEMVKDAEESKNDISKVEGKAEEILSESENVSLLNTGPLDYNSPLIAFNKVSNNSDRIDPNVMVCQFDLMGVCKDKECTYQHFRSMQSMQCDPVAGKLLQEE